MDQARTEGANDAAGTVVPIVEPLVANVDLTQPLPRAVSATVTEVVTDDVLTEDTRVSAFLDLVGRRPAPVLDPRRGHRRFAGGAQRRVAAGRDRRTGPGDEHVDHHDADGR